MPSEAIPRNPSCSVPVTEQEAPLPEAAQIARARAGDMAAFEEVVRLYEALVYTFLFRFTGSREEAEDLLQETFLRVFESLKQFDGTRPFRPWLFRIATNLAISQRRKTRPVVPLGDGWDLPDESRPGPQQYAEASQRRERLVAAMQLLPGEPRALLLLFYEEEMSIDQIAVTLGRQPGAVKVALHRARVRLREIMLERERSPRS